MTKKATLPDDDGDEEKAEKKASRKELQNKMIIDRRVRALDSLKGKRTEEEKGVIDPTGTFATPVTNLIDTQRFHVFGTATPKPVEHIEVFDTETAGLNPGEIHVGVFANGYTRQQKAEWQQYEKGKFRNSFKFRKAVKQQNCFKYVKSAVAKPFKFTPKRPHYVYTKWEDIIKHVYKMAIGAPESKRNFHVYAHNGSGFDWIGLADYLKIAYRHNFVDEFETEHFECKATWEIVSVGTRDWITVSLTQKWKPGYDSVEEKSAGAYEDDFAASLGYKKGRGRPKNKVVTYRKKPIKRRIRLIDSLWMLSAPLKKFGSKWKTPEKYTTPFSWTREHYNLPKHTPVKELMEMWHKYVPEVDGPATEYCVNDCEVLGNALEDLNDLIHELFPRLYEEMGSSALDYLTGPKLAITCSILMSSPPKLPPGLWCYKAANSTEWRIETKRPKFRHDEDPMAPPPRHTQIPLARVDEEAICTNAWFIHGHINQVLGMTQFGGRCEVFAARNPAGTRMWVVDAKSMYPSVQYAHRFVDPRYMLTLEEDIVGRAAILAHLENHSGQYLIESREAVNPLIRQYPVFPMKTTTSNPDQRLIYADWEGILRLNVTGEELRHFLNNTEVVDDNIRIIGRKTFAGELMKEENSKWGIDSPFKQFITKLYDARFDYAKRGEEGKAQMAKILMNSSYGKLLEVLTDYVITYYMEGEHYSEAAVDRVIEKLKFYDPEFEFRCGDEFPAVKEILRFCVEHYIKHLRYEDQQGNPMAEISMPSKRSGYAVVIWGNQTTAYARVALHNSIMTVAKAGRYGIGLMYSDTDSIHFYAPEHLSLEEITKILKEIGLSVGDNLTQWAFEEKDPDPDLIDEDNLGDYDIRKNKKGNWIFNSPQGYYLGPKNYHWTDRNGNILYSTLKGLSDSSPVFRPSLLGVQLGMSKLGEKRGIDLSMILDRDAGRNIGEEVRREYALEGGIPNLHSSYAVTLKPNQTEETHIEAMKVYGTQNGNSLGVREAWEEYKKCNILGKSVVFWRNHIETMYREIQNEHVMSKAEGDLFNSEIIHEKIVEYGMHIKESIYDPER